MLKIKFFLFLTIFPIFCASFPRATKMPLRSASSIPVCRDHMKIVNCALKNYFSRKDRFHNRRRTAVVRRTGPSWASSSPSWLLPYFCFPAVLGSSSARRKVSIERSFIILNPLLSGLRTWRTVLQARV